MFTSFENGFEIFILDEDFIFRFGWLKPIFRPMIRAARAISRRLISVKCTQLVYRNLFANIRVEFHCDIRHLIDMPDTVILETRPRISGARINAVISDNLNEIAFLKPRCHIITPLKSDDPEVCDISHDELLDYAVLHEVHEVLNPCRYDHKNR